jgi:MYXO-CTERM domain-containing protein
MPTGCRADLAGGGLGAAVVLFGVVSYVVVRRRRTDVVAQHGVAS